MTNQNHLQNLRHSCAHLLAAAVLELYPNTLITIGPAIENGFYYDFDFSEAISDIDLPKIEKKMTEIIKSWDKFSYREVTEKEAKSFYKNNPFKLELIEEIVKKSLPAGRQGEKITFYKAGNFEDLCRGGHSENPQKDIGAFKLLSIAGAYWRGDEKNKMLTRIYGTAFPTQKELADHLTLLEETKKRDHRKIGKNQELFFIDDMVGKGLVMWLPKGNIVKEQIENLAKELEAKQGYQRVTTPHIAKEELFQTSGHLPYYQDSMYPPMKMDDGTYYLKAMNCPHHHRIYQHSNRSYKELPLKIAEYGTVYRNELSGTLAGLLRVRALDMNDAHIYARKDQIKDEFKAVLKLTIDYFEIFGLKDYWFRLSKWDPKYTDKYINEPKNWDYTEKVIREVLEEMKVKFIEADNEAAFYGPKVDIQFKSIIGREESMSTIQLDFMAKSRFGLSYIDETGQENNEVFVIHRAPLSTHERFMAFLIEHTAGAFPLWLAPVQVILLPIADRHNDFAEKLNNELLENNIRSQVDTRPERLQAKIRDATLQKVPFMGIIGDKEIADEVISVRARTGEDLGLNKLPKFLQKLKEDIDKKR